jgi:cytochrome c oxidase assembly protein subunit 15
MSLDLPAQARHQPWLVRYCAVALVFTTFVLFAGAFTTSIHAGMAFKDWPLSNGSLNPPGWISDEDMRAEHSHRLLAESVGFLALGAMVWILRTEKRRWIRRLSIALVLMIVFQGILGGSRVLFDKLNIGTTSNVVAQTFAVLHATGAEITLCLWVTLAAALSRSWIIRGIGATPVSATVRRWATAAVALLFVQIVIGAVVRQGGYALAVPYFPFSGPDHELLPPGWNWGVIVNLAHRVGAGLVTITLCGLAFNVFRDPPARRQFGAWMAVILATLVLQVFLGAFVIWTLKNPDAATTHMLVGAFLLASTWLLTLLAHRAVWWPNAAAEYVIPPAVDTPAASSVTTRPA